MREERLPNIEDETPHIARIALGLGFGAIVWWAWGSELLRLPRG
jgi:hypothetical protein